MSGFIKAVALSGRCAAGVVLGLSAALLSLTPYFTLLEEKMGLGLLFVLRGERPAPEGVAIVNIDRESARLLSAPDDPEQWPRRLHADLIRRLHSAGAEMIAFDIFFGAEQPEDDAEMGAAMREFGAVVLANYLRLKHLRGDAYLESLEQPPATLASAASATAPFLLPQGEETDRFFIRYGEVSENPTFPLVVFRLFVLKKLGGEWERLLRESGEPLPQGEGVADSAFSRHATFFADLERRIERQAGLRDRLCSKLRTLRLPHDQHAALLALIESFAGNKVRYFNHYGPAGAISRLPYHRLLGAQDGPAIPDLKGKLVLVGFDENFRPDTAENVYFSPFSQVGSLELAATAVANLLDHDDIRPVFGRWSQFAWLLLLGFLFGSLSSKRLRVNAAGVAALSCVYLAAAWQLFSLRGLWMPVILPLFWLAPLGMLWCLIDNYVTRTREHRKIYSVISRFIPEEAVSRSENSDPDARWESKVSFGVCLASDAGQYTALAEKMTPTALGELMNDYYSALFPHVRSHKGWVSDVTGDAMLAIWTIPGAQTDIRLNALRAALEILQTVEQFQADRRIRLPIRMGLHCGEMRVGFVGGKEHGAWRAVGDTVNTAARLEGLNKLLGTRILVSEALLETLPGFLMRPMGRFMLAGKSHPLTVFELIAPLCESAPGHEDMIARFAEALALFQKANWQEAALAFEALKAEFPDDGPIRFYARTARSNAENPLTTQEMTSIPVDKPPPGEPAAP